ncbi:MAG: hypothetical protein F8N36_13590 [Desulfovibrio sp.]|uniref:hypothetical protein n=1 Tax=Desulfovibrio sp. TaxID=885 RepID=UPI00135EF158|nr:hypothetical protein [Desulfovibrio sp.]MTJ93872.1 hypothetical protein [Desulfovibrio sp.]
MEDFYRAYGLFDGVTVDVARFVDSVERTGVDPDQAFKQLRATMWSTLADARNNAKPTEVERDGFFAETPRLVAIG